MILIGSLYFRPEVGIFSYLSIYHNLYIELCKSLQVYHIIGNGDELIKQIGTDLFKTLKLIKKLHNSENLSNDVDSA